MRKSTIFLSAVLTTFALVMLYRVVSAYNNNQNTTTEVAAQPSATLEPTATEPPEEPAPTDVALGPEQAAQLAAKVVGNTDLLSAESSTYNGMNAWLITFTNNDVVYIGMDGQVLGIKVAPVVVNVPAPAKEKTRNRSNTRGGGGGGGGGGEHQEEHDDD